MNNVELVGYGSAALASLFITAAQIAPILDDPKGTERTLIAQGFEPVEVGGGVWFGGSSGDLWRTRFTATNPNGVEVEGYATRGLLKGTTLRFD